MLFRSIGGSDECGRSFHCGTDRSPVSYQLPVQLQIYINKSTVTLEYKSVPRRTLHTYAHLCTRAHLCQMRVGKIRPVYGALIFMDSHRKDSNP